MNSRPGSSAHHWDELLALVQGVVGVHEDTLSLRLKVLLSLLGIHGGLLIWQQPVTHVLYTSSPAHAHTAWSTPARLDWANQKRRRAQTDLHISMLHSLQAFASTEQMQHLMQGVHTTANVT